MVGGRHSGGAAKGIGGTTTMTQGSGNASFRVHLESLTAFVAALDSQLDALGRPAGALAGLTQQPLPWGLFAEADSLGRQHEAAAAQMADLIQSVRDSIGFVRQVTRTVATQYQNYDEAVAGSYRSVNGG